MISFDALEGAINYSLNIVMWYLLYSCAWFNAKRRGYHKKPPSVATIAPQIDSRRKTTIEDLCEYSILHVCSFLDFQDKISLILAFDRFHYICPEIDLKVLQTRFNILESKLALSLGGLYVRKLHYKHKAPLLRPFYDLMFEAAKYCSNVRELEVILIASSNCSPILASHKYFYHFSDLINSLNFLQVLRLRGCALSDRNCKEISNLSLLESLDLSFNSQITGRYLWKLENLTYLNLTQCFKVKSNHFIEICESIKLHTLSIIGCYDLSNAAIGALVRTQNQLEIILAGKNERANLKSICWLEKLKYMQTVGPECFNVLNEAIRLNRDFVESVDIMVCEEDDFILGKVAQIRNLNRLNLYDMQAYPEFLIDLTLNCSQLEELSIPNSYIQESILLSIVRDLERLKFLDVTGCHQMDVTVFHKIVAIMQMRELKPIRINVTRTHIQKDFLETEEYLNAKDFVTLSFDCNTTNMFYRNEYLGCLECGFSEDVIILQEYVNYRRRNRAS